MYRDKLRYIPIGDYMKVSDVTNRLGISPQELEQRQKAVLAADVQAVQLKSTAQKINRQARI